MPSKLKLNWVRKRKRSAPDLPCKPPIHLGPFSNGEVFCPRSPLADKVERLIMEKAEEGARRHNVDRREFLASSMGMATSLWALNVAAGCSSGGTTMPSGGSSGSSAATIPNGGAGAAMAGVPPEMMAGNPAGMPGMAGAPMPMGGMPPSMGAGGSPMMGSGADAGMASGPMFTVPEDPTDMEAVCEMMLDPSKEFIFDIQTHHVNRADTAYADFLRDQLQYRQYCMGMNIPDVECFGRNEYVRLMFLESDTTVAVLSGLPAATAEGNPITNEEIAQARDAINLMADGSERLVNHHMVLPNRVGTSAADVAAELDQMDQVLAMYGKIGAWKSYPAWSPENTEQSALNGFRFDDPVVGIPFIERGLKLGVPLFCIHKGLPIPAFSAEYNDPGDIGVVAKMFPEARFVVYHSGYGNVGMGGGFNSYAEGPYVMGNRGGVNSLITSLLDAGVGPNENVYAELGTTWQMLTAPIGGLGFLSGPDGAAHVLGKLLKYVGEDNILWGTDSIWYGSPQQQIETFLAFNIPQALQDMHGYPALTMDIKRKILGLNSARVYGIDAVAKRCQIQSSALQTARLYLDDVWGGRRWTMQRPALYSRRRFFELLRRDNMPG